MKPAPFAYCRPQSLEEVIAVLGEHGDEAKLLAGGQSLVPMLNFRLARPAVLVDLQRVEGLDEISVTDQTLSIGAMARQARVARSAVVAARAAILPEALRHVGHHQIRTRGTVGGSLAHADPAAELPAVVLLLEAEIEAQGPDGPRRIPAAAFFEGPYSTSLADDEVLTAVHVPSLGVDAWWFGELARRGGDFAVAGLAAARIDGVIRLVGFGVGWVPVRLSGAEAVLQAGPDTEATADAAAAAAHDEVDPVSDVHADAAYRREAIATLVRGATRGLLA